MDAVAFVFVDYYHISWLSHTITHDWDSEAMHVIAGRGTAPKTNVFDAQYLQVSG